jgi:hypothetical protein
MTVATAQLPREIDRYLSRFAARRAVQRIVRAAGRAVLLALAWVAVWCALDRLFGLPPTVRLVGLLANVACVLTLLARPALAPLRRPDPTRLALDIERRHPRLGQRLATVTSRALGPQRYLGSRELFAALSDELARQVRDEDPAAILPWWPNLRPWAASLAVLALLVPLSLPSWVGAPTLLRRYAAPLANIPAVTTTRLAVQPGDVALPQGDTLRVRVVARRLPVDAPPPVLHVRSAGGAWFERPMSPLSSSAFEARLPNVTRDLRYFVTGGDATTPVRTVTVLPKPAVQRFRIAYAYPPYTDVPPRQVDSASGRIEAPAGTEVTLTVEATQPLRLAVMAIGGQVLRMSPTTRPGAWSAHLTMREDRRYTIRMGSQRGGSGAFRGGIIRSIPDRPPVALLLPPAAPARADDAAGDGGDGGDGGNDGGDAAARVAAADAVVPVTYQAADDYPLARLDREMAVSDPDGARPRLAFLLRGGGAAAAGSRQALGTWPMDLRALGARAGDTVELRLRAEDRAGQFDLSPPLRWTVIDAAGEPGMVAAGAPPGASAPGEAAPATQPAAAGAAEAPPPVPLDPSGYESSLKAYFDALRHGLGATHDR